MGLLKGAGELTAVVESEPAGDLQNRKIRFLQQSCGSPHFLPPEPFVDRHPEPGPEAVFDLRIGDPERLRKLRYGHLPLQIGKEILFEFIRQFLFSYPVCHL